MNLAVTGGDGWTPQQRLLGRVGGPGSGKRVGGRGGVLQGRLGAGRRRRMGRASAERAAGIRKFSPSARRRTGRCMSGSRMPRGMRTRECRRGKSSAGRHRPSLAFANQRRPRRRFASPRGRPQRRHRRADRDPPARDRRLAGGRDAPGGHRPGRRDSRRPARARHVRARGDRVGRRWEHRPPTRAGRPGWSSTFRSAAARRSAQTRSRRRRHARAHAAEIRIGYRKRAWLRGVLRSGGGLLPDTAWRSRCAGCRGDWPPLTEVVTDGNGGYWVRLPRGVSREVRVKFPAADRCARPPTWSGCWCAAGRSCGCGRASCAAATRSRSRSGRPASARVPAAGKLIQIQYLDGRRWRPAVKLGHTNRRGRFAIRYRFRRISRPTRIYFRILVPAEGGWPYATGRLEVPHRLRQALRPARASNRCKPAHSLRRSSMPARVSFTSADRAVVRTGGMSTHRFAHLRRPARAEPPGCLLVGTDDARAARSSRRGFDWGADGAAMPSISRACS